MRFAQKLRLGCRFKCIQWVDEPMNSRDAALTHQMVQPGTCTAGDLSWLVAADCKSADGSTNPHAITKHETLEKVADAVAKDDGSVAGHLIDTDAEKRAKREIERQEAADKGR
jgi:hypothetical protein